MLMKFHGPLDRVTGSCTEMYDAALKLRFLVDCGVMRGEGAPPEAARAPFPFDPAKLDFVILTHAHLDHCGRIPHLVRAGFRGPVYCTQETAGLARIVLRDAAQFNGYTAGEVDAIRFVEPRNALFETPCPVATNLFLSFTRTGHLLGATAVGVLWGALGAQRGITFSGDLGPCGDDEGDGLIRFRMGPFPAGACVIESTYGGRVRAPAETDPETRLARLRTALDDALKARGGVTILPAFALGRAQELLLDLHTLWCREPLRYAGVPVFVDFPMAERANLVYAGAIGRTYTTRNRKTRPAWLSKALFGRFGLDPKDPADEALLVDCLREMLDPRHMPTVARRDALGAWMRLHGRQPCGLEPEGVRGPAVVVTGGGMCEGGRVQAWLRAHLASPTTTVLLSGYCAPGSVGHTLTGMNDRGAEGRARLARAPLSYEGPVRAQVSTLTGYSAHADQQGLLRWLFEPSTTGPTRVAGRTIFIQHGDPRNRSALADAVEHRAAELSEAVRVELPTAAHGWFDLDADTWLTEGATTEALLRARIAELERRLVVRPPSPAGHTTGRAAE